MEAAAVAISGVHCRMSFTCTPVATHDSRGKYSCSRIARISGPNNLRLLAFLSSCLSSSNERRCRVRRAFSSTSDSAATAQDQLALILEVDDDKCLQEEACSILIPRLLKSLNFIRDLEERVLATVVLLNLVKNTGCFSMMYPFNEDNTKLLRNLSLVTWTAEELLSMENAASRKQ